MTVALVEQGPVRNATLSATISMQLICTAHHSFQYACTLSGFMLTCFRRELSKSRSFQLLLDRLTDVASSATSNLVKLLKGLEGGWAMYAVVSSTYSGIGIENMIRLAHKELLQNISMISVSAGELAMATQVPHSCCFWCFLVLHRDLATRTKKRMKVKTQANPALSLLMLMEPSIAAVCVCRLSNLDPPLCR
jgi:hypothetical protein